MDTNPFKYGTDIPTGKYFADREDETRQLINDIKKGQRVMLFSLRRYGKTSLIHNVLLELEKQGFIVAYIDISTVIDKIAFIDKYKSLFIKKVSKQWFIDWAQKFLSKIKIQYEDMTLDFSGLKEIEVDKAFGNIIDLPEKLANKNKKRVVIAFDEFQSIIQLDGEKVENLLRSKIQFHKNVSYVFSGSKHHILLDMFTTPAKPFYKSAKITELKKIPEKEYSAFIKERFKDHRIKIDDSIINRILEQTENHTYYVQQLCHEIWDACKLANENRVTEKHIEFAFEAVLSNQKSIFEARWERLSSGYRRFLIGILTIEESIWSKEFKEATNLTEGGIQKAVKVLSEDYIIEKTEDRVIIPDIFFKTWMQTYVLSNAKRA